MSEVFTEEELNRLVEAVEKNGYLVGPMGTPPTHRYRGSAESADR